MIKPDENCYNEEIIRISAGETDSGTNGSKFILRISNMWQMLHLLHGLCKFCTLNGNMPDIQAIYCMIKGANLPQRCCSLNVKLLCGRYTLHINLNVWHVTWTLHYPTVFCSPSLPPTWLSERLAHSPVPVSTQPESLKETQAAQDQGAASQVWDVPLSFNVAPAWGCSWKSPGPWGWGQMPCLPAGTSRTSLVRWQKLGGSLQVGQGLKRSLHSLPTPLPCPALLSGSPLTLASVQGADSKDEGTAYNPGISSPLKHWEL